MEESGGVPELEGGVAVAVEDEVEEEWPFDDSKLKTTSPFVF